MAVSLRKPPQPANIDAFVSGETQAAPSAKAAVTSPDPLIKHGSREFREMTLYLPAEVARELAFFCIDQKRDVNTVVAEAVTHLVTPESAAARASEVAPTPTPVFSEPPLWRKLLALTPWRQFV
ncbi:MAG TPA: hypothetical protein VK524_21680 [Polyangiaceae bacterium]|nr:hypothetical protein [Polyangiaceae bacterium]